MPRVVVHLRRRDLLRAQFQMIRRMRVFKFLFAAFVLYGAWQWYTARELIPWFLGVSTVISAIVITLVMILLTYAVVAPLMLLKLRRTPGVLGEHSFEITPDGLREVTDVSEIRVAWGSASKVFRTRSFLFALIESRGAFLFPRRSFADGAAYDEFWNALQPLAGKKNS